MATCRSRGAAIIWAKTESGKSIPLDATPTERGNMVLIDGTVRVVKGPHEYPEEDRFTSHFATCPQHQQWRKKKS